MQKRCSCSENSFPPRISGYTGCSSACAPLSCLSSPFCSGPFEPLGGFFQGIAILRPPNMRIRGGLPLVPIALFATQKAGMRFPAHAGRSVFRRACTRRADVPAPGSRAACGAGILRPCACSGEMSGLPKKRRGPKQGRAVSSWFQPPCYLPQRFCMSLRSRARVAQRPDRVVVVEAVENLGDILGHVHAAEPLRDWISGGT